VLTALAPSLGCLRPVVLEIAAAHPAAFSAGFGSALAVFGKVAGPATVLSPIVHHRFPFCGVWARIDVGHSQANVSLESWFQLERNNPVREFEDLTFRNAARLRQRFKHERADTVY
jgi:hypothetical protein